jgi:hypothetical protein
MTPPSGHYGDQDLGRRDGEPGTDDDRYHQPQHGGSPPV